MTQQFYSSVYIWRKKNTLIQKDTCIPNVHSSIFTIAKIWKQSKCPSKNEWIKKIIYIYTHTYICIYIIEDYSAIKEWTFAIWNNMDGLGGFYAKCNNSDTQREIPCNIMCGI